jgi:hypothetical protein
VGPVIYVITIEEIIRRSTYTAKNQYRKFETNIPRKEIAGPQSVPIFTSICDLSVSDLYIYSHDGSAYPAAGTCRPILGIYKSLTDT